MTIMAMPLHNSLCPQGHDILVEPHIPMVVNLYLVWYIYTEISERIDGMHIIRIRIFLLNTICMLDIIYRVLIVILGQGFNVYFLCTNLSLGTCILKPHVYIAMPLLLMQVCSICSCFECDFVCIFSVLAWNSYAWLCCIFFFSRKFFKVWSPD